MLSFIAPTQDGKVQYKDNLNQIWVEEDRRSKARVTEIHVYTDAEVARELALKVQTSVHSEFDELEGLLPSCPSITISL